MATPKIKTQYYYDFVGKLKDGMAVVRNNGKYGFVNKTGQEIVPPIYDFASDFKDGKAEVKYKNQLRTIDSEGKTIAMIEIKTPAKVEMKVELKSNNHSNVALIEEDMNDIELPEEKQINENQFNSDLVKFKKKGKLGLKDLSGKVIATPIYNAFIEFGNGLIMAKRNRKWGLINMSGEEVTEIKYDDFWGKGVRVGHLWGLLDENGNEIITPKYFNRDSLYKSKDDFRKDLLKS